MGRYHNYLEDKFQKVPRTSQYRRNHTEYELSVQSSDDSVEDAQWREYCNCQSSSDSNNTDSDSTSQHNSIRSSSSNEALPAVTHENTFIEQNNNQQSSSILEQTADASQISRNDRNQLYGLSDSEDENFQDSWVYDAHEELFQFSDEDDNDNDDDDVCEEVSSEDVNSENNYIGFSRLIEMTQKDENNETINAQVVVSKAEILLAVLKYGITYCLSQSALADLFKMLNCFFNFSLLPSTRYLVDQMFNPETVIEYHAVCPCCKKYVAKFDRKDRRVECQACDTVIELKDTTYNDFFAIMNVNNEIANLIQDNQKYYDYVIRERVRNHEKFDDITDGVLYKEFVDLLSTNDKLNFATTTMNSDGAPIFESSRFSIWPIQMIINELPLDVRTSRPVVCGIWFGKDKPNMNIFLKPYIVHMNKLSNDGVRCTIANEVRTIKVFTICCCVDSVARAPMQGMVQYNGYFGCNWCLHPGYYVFHKRGGSVKYTLLNEIPPKRTEIETIEHMRQSLTSRNPVYGVKRPSCLINLHGFNIISGFVPDSMHCLCLGIAEQFLRYWIESNNLPYSLSNNDINKIDNVLLTIKAPNQIARLSRSIRDKKYWKAREWENWILYYSLPILLCFPHLEIWVKHWSLLVEAFYILLKKSITRDEVNYAHTLLTKFVCYTEHYYSKAAMTYNVHQLLHLAQSVADWGPLWAHSGYCFENGNGQLVRKIHGAKGVVHQICRSIAMSQSELILKKHVALKAFSNVNSFISYLDKKTAKQTCKLWHARYFGPHYKTSLMWIEELELSDESRTYQKIVKERCLYTSSKRNIIRSDNSYALTTEGIFIHIVDFIIDAPTRKEYTICHLVNTEDIFNNNSLPLKKVVNISDNLVAKDTNSIEKICVFMNIDNMMYICAVPNLYFY
ncbi:uncharacterized protein LOC112467697 isoform X1 [Temnothorax curvispinosus]|uniref:Uncharacterized protein LOC112467697 isoform X1 n=1 Tax=Temnothorax curvispinosus TaxID=300111 RepID=A0A6J1RH91_9HYME|nr:uncharacterized protein LOC112467697 isoform X1 [Temnothorax curvispinosus]